MRSTIPGLPTARPLVDLLPGVLQEDEFAQRFTAGLDDVLAPVFATLDSLVAYVDPWLAPEDFLSWLGGWVGVEVDEDLPVEVRRALVARAVEQFRARGTVAGLRAHVSDFFGGRVQVTDSGGVAWSAKPGGAAESLPEAEPRVKVRLTVSDPGQVSKAALQALVAAAKPAHVMHEVEVRGR
jgi:phage tail-like protein